MRGTQVFLKQGKEGKEGKEGLYMKPKSYTASHNHSIVKINIAFIGAAVLSGSLWAQSAWPSYPNNTAISLSGGNVGIGTTSPLYAFDFENGGLAVGNHAIAWLGRTSISESGLIVGYHSTGSIADYPIVRAGGIGASGLALAGDSVNQAALFIKSGGNVGIGTSAPSWPLEVFHTTNSMTGQITARGASAGGGIAGLNIAIDGSNLWQMITDNTVGGPSQNGLFLQYGGSATSRFFTINTNGNVGIGTTAPPYPLSVKGIIGAGEVIVTTTSGWPDYVFAPDYRLPPLNEVAAYVKENHHLPEIPSEAEVKEKGVSLGEMQAKLLAKIEELTLHMIQAEERNSHLEQQNRDLQTRVTRLESPASSIQQK